MPKDYVTILRTILKEYVTTHSISSTRIDDIVELVTQLSFQDVVDAMNELLDEIHSNPKTYHIMNTADEWRQLLMDRQDKQVIFDLLLD